jgi:hypothetical protein
VIVGKALVGATEDAVRLPPAVGKPEDVDEQAEAMSIRTIAGITVASLSSCAPDRSAMA